MDSRGIRPDVGRRCEERIDVNWARWSDTWTAPDSISAVVPAVGRGRAVGAGGEMAVEIPAEVAAVFMVVLIFMRGVEAVERVAVVGARAVADEVGRTAGEVAEGGS